MLGSAIVLQVNLNKILFIDIYFIIKSDGFIYFMYSGILLIKEGVGSWFKMEADVDYDGELSIKSSKARKRSR